MGEIKLLWGKSEKITYKQLEEIQKQKWKQVIYKSGTLRNYAYKKGWNRNKGRAIEEKREELEKRGEIFSDVLKEIENLGEC